MLRTIREVYEVCCGISEEEENDTIRTVGRKEAVWGQVVFQLDLKEIKQKQK